MTKLLVPATALLALIFVLGCAAAPSGGRPQLTGTSAAQLPFQGRSIEGFVGSASKPPTEEAAALFQKMTGAQITLHYGGSGAMLSQMKLTQRGDIYFPGSSDFMELAKRQGLVRPETERRVVYLIPAINVPKGNPKNIHSLLDLTKPGVRVAIARPDTVCVGLYAVEVIERAGIAQELRPNIVTNAESCEATAALVSLGSIDAVLGWSVFQYWDPEHIETILLPPQQVARIGYIPIAVSAFAEDIELALTFVDFLTSQDGQAIYKKWHYLTTEEEARQFALPTTPVGGEWPLPESWR